MKKSVVNVINLLGTDKVYIPKAVMKREYISEDTKLMFGIIFSECLRNITDFTVSSEQASEMVRKFAEVIEIGMIANECFCSNEEAKKIKSELIYLTATLNIVECFQECELNVVNNANPVCRACENGKLIYLLTNFFKLSINDVLEHYTLTKEEKELLSAFSENINQELISSCFCILRRKTRKITEIRKNTALHAGERQRILNRMLIRKILKTI